MIQNTSIRASLNTAVLYMKLLLSTVIALFNVPLLLKAIGIENYGIFNVVGGVIALLMFLNSTMSAATNRFLGVCEGRNGNPAEKQSVFLHCLYIHIAIASILFLGFEVIALFFWNDLLNIAPERTFAAKVVFQTMAVTTFFSVATVPHGGVVIIKERMIFVALLTLAVSAAKLGITFLLFAVNADRLIVYALLLLLIHLVERAAYIAYAHCLEQIRYCWLTPDFSLLKKMIGFFGWNMTINFSLSAQYNITSLMLNRFFGVLVNAAEGIALQVAGQLSGVCGSLQNAVTPIIMKKQGGQQSNRALEISLTSCRMSVYLLLMTGTMVFVEMPYLLKIWLKTVPEYAVVFCRLILLRILIDQATIPLETLMKANGDVKKMQLFSSAAILMTIGVEFFVLKTGGAPYSVYFCMMGTMTAVGWVRFGCAQQHYGLSGYRFLRDNVLRLIGVMFFGWFTTSGVALLLPQSFLRCVLSFLASCLFTGMAIFCFGITQEERKIFRSMFQQIMQKYGKNTVIRSGNLLL